VNRLEAAILQVVAGPEIREQLQRVGLETSAAGTAQFETLLRSDIKNWAAIIKDLGVKIE
jgi:tripartite-type tricarboxylate transporter receptor subunit TctC